MGFPNYNKWNIPKFKVPPAVYNLGAQRRQIGMGFIGCAMVLGNVMGAEGHKAQWDHMNKDWK